MYHVIMIMYCHWWEFWSCDTDIFIISSTISIKNDKLMNVRSKHKFFWLLWNIVVFRLVAYLLNMIYLKLIILYQILDT